MVPVAWRRWRKSLYWPPTLAEIAGNLRTIRAHAYDEIVDSQGLVRSAVIARLAHGRRHGYDAASIREPLAARFYDRATRSAATQHAVARNRILSGLALGYTPQGEPDFGLERARFARAERALRRAAARHRAARPSNGRKRIGSRSDASSRRAGSKLVLPWGSEDERARSERIAAALPRARVPARAPLDEVAGLIAGAQLVVGVDTGLLHLAAAFGVPLVAIFTGSEPGLTGPVGSRADRGARRQRRAAVGRGREASGRQIGGLNIRGEGYADDQARSVQRRRPCHHHHHYGARIEGAA